MPDKRKAKGVNFIELIKLLKIHRREHPLPALSPETEELMEQRILPNSWYPFPILVELIDVAYGELLGRDPQKALQMGITGGEVALRGVHRGFIVPGDPTSTFLAMRHTWRTYFDFGELTAEVDGDGAVRFTLSGYPDCTEPHGMLIVGWPLAAARVVGAEDARLEVISSPWQGADQLVYRTFF